MRLILLSGVFGLFIFGSWHATAQQPVFRSLLDIPLIASGTFGEMRQTHLHSGVDFKTKGIVNQRVYSIESGYVSRIKVSARGLGNTLYITHPGGYVSVYGHLNSFSPAIARRVSEEQYTIRSFEIDIMLPAHAIDVGKGEVIGLSGNTGSSFGPHLHFELRDELSENTLNPFIYGIALKDTRSPLISALKVYPYGMFSRVNASCSPLSLAVNGQSKQYSLKGGDTLAISGLFFLGLQAWDLLDMAENPCGVYSMKVFLDKQLVYHHQLDTLSFYHARYYLSFMDYAENRNSGRRLMTTYVAPNNQMPIYRSVANNGVFCVGKSGLSHLEIQVADYAGNTSRLQFFVKEDTLAYSSCKTDCAPELLIVPNKPFSIETADFQLAFPLSAVFDSCCFQWTTKTGGAHILSPIMCIGNPDIPLLKPFQFKLKPFASVDNELCENSIW